jgi:hypothetical protein
MGNTGENALHPLWREARWNVTGMFTMAKFLVRFIEEVQRRLQVRPLFSVHGCPLSFKWNGGRADFRFTPDQDEVDGIMEAYEALKLPCLLTFSNRFLTKADLNDYDCNYLLDKLACQDNPDSGVIVTSDLLSDYIQKKYPKLKRVASIIKVTCDEGAGDLQYYRDLEARFDGYAVASEDVWNEELLSQLDTAKAEILANCRCLRRCPHSARHYDFMAKVHDHHSFADRRELAEFQRANCRAYPIARQLSGTTRSNTLTAEELHRLYLMGFRNFKLQGRYTASQYSVLYDMATYIFEPCYTSALIFHSFG